MVNTPDLQNTIETTDDAFLGGRIMALQLKDGYRAAVDTVMLAAAAPVLDQGGRMLELGCGVGVASLCYAARVPFGIVTGLELAPGPVELALENSRRNGLSDRFLPVQGNIRKLEELELAGQFDQVMANPPYLAEGRALLSPNADRRRSNVEADGALSDWLDAMLSAIRPKGGLTLVQRADRLAEIINHLDGRVGEIEIIPLWPRAGIAAKRIILRARKDVRGGSKVHPGLVLHGDGNAFTPKADGILRHGEALI